MVMTKERRQRIENNLENGNFHSAFMEIVDSLEEFGDQPLMNENLVNWIDKENNLLNFITSYAKFDPVVNMKLAKYSMDENGKKVFEKESIVKTTVSSFSEAKKIAKDHFSSNKYFIRLNIEELSKPWILAEYDTKHDYTHDYAQSQDTTTSLKV